MQNSSYWPDVLNLAGSFSEAITIIFGKQFATAKNKQESSSYRFIIIIQYFMKCYKCISAFKCLHIYRDLKRCHVNQITE